MTDANTRGDWARRLTWLALILSLGGVAAALVAAVGSGAGAWTFRTGFTVLRYAFFAAVAGGVVAIVAFGVGRRAGVPTGRLNLLAVAAALLFAAYLIPLVSTARSVPAIHDATTDLADPPRFAALAVRADNLDKVPDQGRAELAALDPESRWKALHREAYGDLRPLRMTLGVADTMQRAEALARKRGWAIATVDRASGTIEATATTFFFRFKDDVAIRVTSDPANTAGAIVDMRSISRVGGSDVGVNAARIRAFLADLKTG